MPFDKDFADALQNTIKSQGWDVATPVNGLPNPLNLVLKNGGIFYHLIIHASRITPQSSSGPNPSDHHRPPGEMHAQMIFDGDKRGSGIKNHLRFADGQETLLFGFIELQGYYVIAAFDPFRHREYSYSKSLQVKFETLQKAVEDGLAFQIRRNGETVVAFSLDQILQYLQFASDFHNLALQNALPGDNVSITVNQVAKQIVRIEDLPLLEATERQRKIIEVGKYIRRRNFETGIKSIYSQCAICNFQFDHIIDAAHIVGVAEGGTDTYDNGLGLCPTCHRMFDKGFILVDETGRIYINPRYAEEYEQQGLAGSLDSLQKTLREFLWLPQNKHHQPSPENLRRTFLARR